VGVKSDADFHLTSHDIRKAKKREMTPTERMTFSVVGDCFKNNLPSARPPFHSYKFVNF
jgi:hypothetical protein